VYIDNVRVDCVDAAVTPNAGDLAFFDGTSMATPHVAGAAALALALKPGTGVAQLKSALLSSGDPDPALLGVTVSGRRLNVANLLKAIADPSPPDDGGNGGGGGGDPAGGGAPPGDVTIPAAGSGTTTAPPNTLGAVTVTRCRQSGRGRNVRLRCRIAHASDVTSARIRLKKGRRTLARQTGWPGSGRLTLRLKRKLKKGRYALKVVLRDAAGHKRTLTVRFRIR
jgi:hypothetical protein